MTGTRTPSLALLGALVALVLAACTPTIQLDASLRGGTTVRSHATLSGEVTVVARGGVLTVTIPASRPAGGITVRPARGRPFDIPPGHYPPPGACRAWVPGVPPGRQTPPGPCPEIERNLPRGAYLVYG